MKFNWFENASPGAKIVLTFALMICSLIVVSFLTMIIAVPIFQKGPLEILTAASNVNDPSNLNVLRFLQLVQSVALFIVPPFILAYLFGSTPKNYLSFNKLPISNLWLLAALILIAFMPFVNLTETLNSHLKLPQSLAALEQWMRSSEDTAAALSKVFLNVNTYSALAFNILLMAVIPAIGEELIFRGIIQKLFTEAFKNIHWGIIISAALFSAFHLQFYGFLPRMLLGMLFGYMFVWSGSIWIPIFAHFLNNAMGVIYFFMTYNGKIDDRLEPFGANVEVTTALVSFAITMGLMYIFQKRAEFEPQKN